MEIGRVHKAILKFIKFSLHVICLPIYFSVRLVVFLIPKKKGLWVFGAWEGKAFADNAKYFYIYICKNNQAINPVWIAKKKSVAEEVNLCGGSGLEIKSAKAIFSCMRAEYVFITHSISSDLSPWFVSGSTLIQLWHASFPLKKMGYDYPGFYPEKFLSRKLLQIYYPGLYIKANLAISASKETQKIVAGALGLPRSKVLLSGFPRSDGVLGLIKTKTDDDNVRRVIGRLDFEHLIYFVPTFRDDKNFNIFGYKFSLSDLVGVLEKTNSILIIRPHPFDVDKLNRVGFPRHPRIIIENHGIADPYPLMRLASILITDFSSIYADFLLLDRPIIFAKFDFDEYLSKERHLYFSYDKVTPGDHVLNWPEMIHTIENILIHKIDSHSYSREKMRSKIFGNFQVENSCQRVFDDICKLGNK